MKPDKKTVEAVAQAIMDCDVDSCEWCASFGSCTKGKGLRAVKAYQADQERRGVVEVPKELVKEIGELDWTMTFLGQNLSTEQHDAIDALECWWVEYKEAQNDD